MLVNLKIFELLLNYFVLFLFWLLKNARMAKLTKKHQIHQTPKSIYNYNKNIKRFI